jgi:hypothetical protein
MQHQFKTVDSSQPIPIPGPASLFGQILLIDVDNNDTVTDSARKRETEAKIVSPEFKPIQNGKWNTTGGVKDETQKKQKSRNGIPEGFFDSWNKQDTPQRHQQAEKIEPDTLKMKHNPARKFSQESSQS